MANPGNLDKPQYQSWYKSGFLEYLSRTARVEAVPKCVREKVQGDRLREAKSCISVGPGPSTMECTIMNEVMTKCTEYFVVEPNPDFVPFIQKNMANLCPNIKVEVAPVYAEDWAGPPHKVDVIILFQVLYFLKNPESFLKKCVQDYLNPGGQIMILMRDVSCSYAEHVTWSPICRHDAHHQHILSLLENLGLMDKTEAISVTYPVNVANISKIYANYCLTKDATEKEAEEFRQYMAKKHPDGVEQEMDWVTVVSP